MRLTRSINSLLQRISRNERAELLRREVCMGIWPFLSTRILILVYPEYRTWAMFAKKGCPFCTSKQHLGGPCDLRRHMRRKHFLEQVGSIRCLACRDQPADTVTFDGWEAFFEQHWVLSHFYVAKPGPWVIVEPINLAPEDEASSASVAEPSPDSGSSPASHNQET